MQRFFFLIVRDGTCIWLTLVKYVFMELVRVPDISFWGIAGSIVTGEQGLGFVKLTMIGVVTAFVRSNITHEPDLPTPC